MKKIIFIVALLFLLVPCVHAHADGTPTIFSYQGRLADSNGDLLGGSSGTTYYFKFSIWDDTTVGSGTRLWPASAPTATSETVRQGVFNVNIGDTANGYPDTLDYDFNSNANIYLQVEVSSDNATFETLSPRQRISSAVFAQIAGRVSGTGQSSFGTVTPASGAVVTVDATSTSAIPIVVRGFLNQTADLFRIVSDAGARLLTFTSGGKLGIGTSTPERKLNVLDVNSVPQMRLSQTGSVHGEFYVDNLGDLWLSSTGKDIKQDDGNFWVCSGGNCAVDAPADQGNLIVETSVVFDNGFRFKQIDASTTIMYDTTGTAILEFDEGQ